MTGISFLQVITTKGVAVLQFAQYFSRINRKRNEPRPDVLAEEYRWVYGRKPGTGREKPRK